MVSACTVLLRARRVMRGAALGAVAHVPCGHGAALGAVAHAPCSHGAALAVLRAGASARRALSLPRQRCGVTSWRGHA